MPRAGRICAHKDDKGNCPFKATHGNRCETHAREYEADRGSKQSRGYDKAHDAARRKAAGVVASGRAVCWRCQGKISPGEEWHLGHRDDGRIGGPEHARSCNLRAAGLKAAGKAWTAPQSADLRSARAKAQEKADKALARRQARERG